MISLKINKKILQIGGLALILLLIVGSLFFYKKSEYEIKREYNKRFNEDIKESGIFDDPHNYIPSDYSGKEDLPNYKDFIIRKFEAVLSSSNLQEAEQGYDPYNVPPYSKEQSDTAYKNFTEKLQVDIQELKERGFRLIYIAPYIKEGHDNKTLSAFSVLDNGDVQYYTIDITKVTTKYGYGYPVAICENSSDWRLDSKFRKLPGNFYDWVPRKGTTGFVVLHFENDKQVNQVQIDDKWCMQNEGHRRLCSALEAYRRNCLSKKCYRAVGLVALSCQIL